MEHEKSFGYTLLLGVCMLISLILIGKMLLYKPAPINNPTIPEQEMKAQDNNGLTGKESGAMQLKAADVVHMIEEQLPHDFPVKGISIAISKDGTIRTEGTLYKDKLGNYVSSDGVMRSALTLMPAEFAFKAVFTTESNKEGTFTLTPQQLSAGGFDLPTSMFSSALTDTLNQAVNTALTENFPGYQHISCRDGALELEK